MNKNVREAQQHAEKIEHYYQHAGAAGYCQVNDYYFQMIKCLEREYPGADNADAIALIKARIDDARPKMVEIKKREDDQSNHTV
jgi:hypothetical protein